MTPRGGAPGRRDQPDSTRSRRDDPIDNVRARRDDPVAEVREELESHFEGSVDLLVSRGWTESAAREEIRRRFGDERRYRAELERSARRVSRRRRLRETWRTIGCAVTTALRGVRRSPGLSLAVVATLALGLGANAAIFRVVDRLLLSPPPHIERPEEVRRLFQSVSWNGDAPVTFGAFTYADVTAMRAAAPVVPLGVVMSYLPETMGAGADAIRLRTGRVDAGYFPLLGVEPVLGRGLLPEDHRTGAAVVVLSHTVWQTRFGGDENVLGRRIRAARGEYEVVGVLPRGFQGSHGEATDLWIPVEAEAADWWDADWRTSPNVLAFHVLARVSPSIRRSTWESRMADAVSTAKGPDASAQTLSLTTSSLVPGSVPNPTGTMSVFRWLAGVSLLVLLVACANTANLFLAHAERQRRETAVRMALGAGAGALRIELLARALCLALLGAAGAVLFAFWGGGLLERVFRTGLLAPTPESPTGRIVVFTAALGILAALLAGLLPALRAPREDVSSTLGGGGRTTAGTGAARRVLAGVQVALCMLLLVGAGLFITSFLNATRVDLGFAHDRLIMLRLERDEGVDIPTRQLRDAAAERIAALPSVVATSGTVAVPFTLMYGLPAFRPDGERITHMHVNAVGPDFFRTMDVPIERGRSFTEHDMREGAEPVVIVSRRAAARLWPRRDPLGECLRVGENGPCGRIIGIAGDHAGVSLEPGELAPAGEMQAWVPFGYPGAQAGNSLLVRTSVPPARIFDDVRRAASGPGVRFVEAELLSDAIARETRSWRLGATVFSLFGVIALLVAAVGLYGVLSFEVAQRRRELGIRLALGAGRLRALLPVLRFAAPVVLAGLLAGGVAALLAAGRVGPLLFGVGPRDPRVLLVAACAILVASALALLVPGWRAANVDPRETLG